eukprot:1300566-Rhodomonas_salina.2
MDAVLPCVDAALTCARRGGAQREGEAQRLKAELEEKLRVGPPLRYAMSGTCVGCATRCPVLMKAQQLCDTHRLCYAMSGTEMRYAATRQARRQLRNHRSA